MGVMSCVELRWVLPLLLLASLPQARAQAAAEIPRAEAESFIADWAKTQQDGDFVRYSAMYAPEFRGVRRTGAAKASLDRDGWLQDRERMFKAPVTIVVDRTEIETAPDQATATFVQRWSSGKFADAGRKRMRLRRGESNLLITEEDMLCSWLVRQGGREVLYVKEDDRAAALAAYPRATPKLQPAKVDACSPSSLGLWTFEERAHGSFPGEAGTYEVVSFSEENNPKATTNLEITAGGGVMLLRDGKRIWKTDQAGCKPAAMFAIPGGVVLPLTCSVAYHGEASSDLEVYRIAGDRVSHVGHVPVAADDSANADSYAYQANIEYRDTDGNGVLDIVVTPTLRRNVGREYPKTAKVIKF